MLTKTVHSDAIRALAVILLGVVAGAVTSSASSAQSAGGWSQPVPLSPAEQSSWFPDIAADTSGQVHVTWTSGIPGYDTVLYVKSQNGTTWSLANDVQARPQKGGAYATRPTLFPDQHGILHMTFRDADLYYSQAPIEVAYSAGAWRPPRLIAKEGYYSQLAADGQGRLHLVFNSRVPDATCLECYQVFHAWSDDNGLSWSNPTNISNLQGSCAQMNILIDREGNVHIVWEAGSGTGNRITGSARVMYVASYDRGQTWTSPNALTPSDREAINVAFGLDGDDKLLVAWLSLPEDVVYYQSSSDHGRSWLPPQPIFDVWGGQSIYGTRLDGYEMATDSAGNVHLVMVGQTAKGQASLSVLHLVWNGSGWSPPEAITTLTGDVPEWPRIAIGLGNQLHVVWFVRDAAHIFDTDRGRYQIWYSRGTASAPANPPIPWPTAIPTPVPTAIPNLAGATSIAPPPARPTLTSPSASDRYSETAGIMVLLQSLLPAVLIIALVIVGLRLLRR